MEKTTVAGGDSVRQADSLPRSVALKLTVIARLLRTRFDQRVQRIGVTRAQWMLISAVSRNPGVTQRAIASLLEVTEVTAGRLIDRLCAEGHLERRENPHDRRAYCVFLTPAAQPILDRLGEIAAIHEREMFAGIRDEDMKTLDTLLDGISHNLTEDRREVTRHCANDEELA